MAKTKKGVAASKTKRGFKQSIVWVANSLSAEKLKHADETSPDDHELFQFMMDCVDSGIDIKISYDTFSEAYQVTAVGAWNNAPSAGYAVSARSARDVRDAVMLIWYKVFVMADGDLSSLLSDKEEDDLRG